MEQRYYVRLEPDIQIDFETHGAEWESHLHRAMTQEMASTGSTGRRIDASTDIPIPHVELTPISDRVTGSLLFVPLASGGRALVVATPQKPGVDELDLWRRVVDRATDDLGQVTSTFDWWASIDCTLRRWPAQELLEDGEIGPLRVDSARVIRNLNARRGDSRQLQWSYPVWVTGTADGYDWQSASRSAANTVHTLLCLLAVAWNYPWDVVDGPQPTEWISKPVRPDDVDRDAAPQNLLPNPVVLPAWRSQAWTTLTTDSVVANAVSAFREGLLLQEDHPSVALLAFVAAIEGVGQKLKKPTRCDKCKSVLEATSRFRQATALVATPDDELVIKRVVDYRNETAHLGALHGYEIVRGSVSTPSFFQLTPTQAFEYDLFAMRRIARDLLLRELGGLPPKSIEPGVGTAPTLA